MANVRWLIVTATLDQQRVSLLVDRASIPPCLCIVFRSRIWHLWFNETWWEKAKGRASLMACFSSGLHCPSFSFRNWYVDEPSCGSEVCVVMYHQPSAPPGIGGSYMFQWNDDRCNMKNNFICKYSAGNDSFPPTMWLIFCLVDNLCCFRGQRGRKEMRQS